MVVNKVTKATTAVTWWRIQQGPVIVPKGIRKAKLLVYGVWTKEGSIGNNEEISSRFNIELLTAGIENGLHRGWTCRLLTSAEQQFHSWLNSTSSICDGKLCMERQDDG